MSEPSDRHADSEKLSLALTAAQLGTWDWDPETDLITLSELAAAMFGLPADAHITRSGMRELLDESDRRLAAAANERAVAQRQDYNLEYRVNRPDGKQIWVAARGRGQYGADGKITRMLGVVQDVTERKNAEAERERLVVALKNERALLEEVFNKSPSFMTIMRGPEHVFDFVNERYYELIGRRQLIGKNVREAIPDIAGQGFYELLDKVYETGEAFVGKAVRAMIERVPGQPMQEVFIDLVYQPLRGPDGAVSAIFAHGVDLTEHKLTEEALRTSQRRLNSLIESNVIGIHVCDEQRVLEANDAYLQIIGYSRADLEAGRIAWRDITPAEFLHLDDASFGEIRRRGRAAPFEKEYLRKDGTRVPILLAIVSLDEEKTRFICLVQDLSRQKQAEKERGASLEKERAARADAERASRMKDEFLATLSHELRTPLNAILGWSQILRSGATSAEDLADGLAVIERNARAQTQIIEDLLDMSRIISGKVRLDVQQMDLADAVTAAIETIRPAANTKGIRLQSVLDPLAHPISGDPNRLQQVFWNLLSNSMKFTPKGGRVQVRLERVNSHVEVSVTDTGEGISPEFLPYVFDRFRQADASSTRRHGGLGLGLSIVKQLVELHGGSVRAKSLGSGKGSTFTVALPLTVIHPDPESLTERRHPHSRAVSLGQDQCVQIAGVRALVVDDEPDARALVKRLLEDCDAIVTTAASAAEALRCVQENQFDLLISDIGMPGEDGYSLIRQIRALPPQAGGALPALALTAYARSDDRVKSVVAGFQMHLAKPVEPAELIAMVASLAGRMRQGEEHQNG